MIQQTIQEVKYEEIILSKKLHLARKNNKIRNWLEYLSYLDANKDNKQKNEAIYQMHKMFILREQFWFQQVQRVLKNIQSINRKSFQLALLALDDGLYHKVGQLISLKLVEAYNEKKIQKSFVIAKLQKLIELFNHCSKQGSHYYETLLQIYIKQNNQAKIKETYRRQIILGFDNYDLTYHKYMKWQIQHNNGNQVDQSQIKKLFHVGKTVWQQTLIFIQQEIPKIMNCVNQIMWQKFKNQLKNNRRYIKLCLTYVQEMNVSKIDEDKYLKILSLFPTQTQKLWYLRRIVISPPHQLVQQYLETLQLANTADEQILQVFNEVFKWQGNQKYEQIYLNYLARRINKHIFDKQISQKDPQYSANWQNNVQFFRAQIVKFIQKPRIGMLASQNQMLRQKLYYFWIELQDALIGQCQTIESLFENFLQWSKKKQIYINYAKYMIKYRNLEKAKFILTKTCETYQYQQSIVKQYQSFLSIYGNLEQVLKLRQKVKENLIQSFSSVIQIPKNFQLKFQQLKKQKKSETISNQSQSSSPHQILHQNQILQSQQYESPPILHKNKYDVEQQQQKPSLKRIAPVQTEQKIQDIPVKKVHLDNKNTLFSNKIDKKWTEQDIKLHIIYKNHLSEIRIIQKQAQKMCYIEFDSQQAAQQQLKQNKSKIKLSFSRPPSRSDDCTLFLCNLPLEITNQQIKNLVSQNHRQQIKDIRIKQKGNKKTAYVQFDSQENRDQVLNQLKRQKIKVQGRSIIVMSCESDNKIKQKKKRTLFLKNISFKCRDKDIRKFFTAKGIQGINQILIPKEQTTNRVKGFAYIQFEKLEEAQKAFQIQKGQLFHRQFFICKSDRTISHHQNVNDNQNRQKKSEKNKEKHQKSQKDNNKQQDTTNDIQHKQKKQKSQNKKSNNFFSNIFS